MGIFKGLRNDVADDFDEQPTKEQVKRLQLTIRIGIYTFTGIIALFTFLSFFSKNITSIQTSLVVLLLVLLGFTKKVYGKQKKDKIKEKKKHINKPTLLKK